MWALGPVWVTGGGRHAGNGVDDGSQEIFKKFWCSHDANELPSPGQAEGGGEVLFLFAAGQTDADGDGANVD